LEETMVVDNKNNPQVVFRGTSGGAERTKRSIPSYTTSEELATIYSSRLTGGGPFSNEETRVEFPEESEVTSGFLDIKNPLNWTDGVKVSMGELASNLKTRFDSTEGRQNLSNILEELNEYEQRGGVFEIADYGIRGESVVENSDDLILVLEDFIERIETAENSELEDKDDVIVEFWEAMYDISIDSYALADLDSVVELAQAQGYDGIHHLDVANNAEKSAQAVLGKSIGEVEGVIRDKVEGFVTDTWRPFREEQVKGGQGRVLKTEDDIVQTLADYGNPTDFEFTKTGVSLTKMVDRFGTEKRVKKTFKPGVAEEEVVSWLQDRRTGALPRRRLPKGEPHGGGSGSGKKYLPKGLVDANTKD